MKQLTPIQNRLWYASKLDGDLPTYNQPMAFFLKGKLNLESFKKTLKKMAAKHPELRMGFPEKNGKPSLILKDKIQIPLIEKDLSETQAFQFVQEFIQTPIDVDHPPLMRAALISLGKEEHIVVFNWHHLIADGHSISIFLKQFSKLYGEQ